MDVNSFKSTYLDVAAEKAGTVKMMCFDEGNNSSVSTCGFVAQDEILDGMTDDFDIDDAVVEEAAISIDDMLDADFDYDELDESLVSPVDNTEQTKSAVQEINANQLNRFVAGEFTDVQINNDTCPTVWQRKLTGCSSIERACYTFLVDNGYSVTDELGTLLPLSKVWVIAYPKAAKLKTDDDVLIEFVKMYYGVCCEYEVLQQIKQLPLEFLEKVDFNHRLLTSLDLAYIVPEYKSAWFDSEIVNRYSVEDRDTSLVIQLLKEGKFDKNEVFMLLASLDVENTNFSQKMISSVLDRYNVYLRLKLENKLNYTRLMAQKVFDCNWENFYTQEVSSEELTFHKLFSSREDFSVIEKVIPLLDGLLSPNEAAQIADYYDVVSILKGVTLGYPINKLTEECFATKCEYSEIAAKYYQEGLLSVRRVSSELPFSVVAVASDMDRIGVNADKALPVITKYEGVLTSLLEAVNEEKIGPFSYNSYLALFGTADETILEFMAKYLFTEYYSFYDFWMTVVFQSNGSNVKINGLTNDNIVVITDQDKIFYLSLNDWFDDNRESVQALLPMVPSVQYLTNNLGVLVCPLAKVNSYSKFLSNFNTNKSSIAVITNRRVGDNEDPLTLNYRMLLRQLRERHGETPAVLSMDRYNQITFDKVFNFFIGIGQEIDTLLWLDSSLVTLKRINSLLRLGSVYSIAGNVILKYLQSKGYCITAARGNDVPEYSGKFIIQLGQEEKHYNVGTGIAAVEHMVAEAVKNGITQLTLIAGKNFLKLTK